MYAEHFRSDSFSASHLDRGHSWNLGLVCHRFYVLRLCEHFTAVLFTSYIYKWTIYNWTCHPMWSFLFCFADFADGDIHECHCNQRCGARYKQTAKTWICYMYFILNTWFFSQFVQYLTSQKLLFQLVARITWYPGHWVQSLEVPLGFVSIWARLLLGPCTYWARWRSFWLVHKKILLNSKLMLTYRGPR